MALVNPAASPGAPLVPVVLGAAAGGGGKDSKWLTLEVCREFARSKCSRSDAECKYAHPPPHVDVQNGRVMCCFDFIKGKCQRKDPPCKYLHPPQHLKEILLQNGRQNLIYKSLALQAASLQTLGCLPQIPLMYEPVSGAVKQTGAAAPTVLFQAGSSVAAAGQYVTMLSAGAGSSSQQYLLPTAATHHLHGAPAACYHAPQLLAAMTDVSRTPHSTSTAAWAAVPGVEAGCYGLPTARVTYDTNHYQVVGGSTSSSSTSSLVDCACSSSTPLISVSSADDSVSVTSPGYSQHHQQQQQHVYYKSPPLVDMFAREPVTAALNPRKRPVIDPPTARDQLILAGVSGGLIAPVLKRPALLDSKTGLPVYRQWTTTYPAPLAAVNTLQQIQSQPFISFPTAGSTQISPPM